VFVCVSVSVWMSADSDGKQSDFFVGNVFGKFLMCVFSGVF